MDAEREELEARLAKLKEQLEAEQAARSFAEGALQAARQERGSRRHDVEGAAGAAPKEPPTPVNESARDKITRLRG
jgi:chromosome segregation ATPase